MPTRLQAARDLVAAAQTALDDADKLSSDDVATRAGQDRRASMTPALSGRMRRGLPMAAAMARQSRGGTPRRRSYEARTAIKAEADADGPTPVSAATAITDATSTTTETD